MLVSIVNNAYSSRDSSGAKTSSSAVTHNLVHTNETGHIVRDIWSNSMLAM